MTATYDIRGDIAVIALDNPPVNGLGLATRSAIIDGLARANADASVRAIILTGAGRAFSGGADIREFGTPRAIADPNLLVVIAALEKSSKPVVAAIHSVAMGGGLELALGCHYRVAAPGTLVALPEVKLGLIPGAGGTVRLPRVIGVETALNMILSGEPARSEVLARMPGQMIFDRMAESPASLIEEALAFARSLAPQAPRPRVRDLPCKPPMDPAYFTVARERAAAQSPGLPAPQRCVDAVENATRLPFEVALQKERDTFLALMTTPESRAMRHVFMAERACARIDDMPAGVAPRTLASVAVIGAGTMGSGIAMNFLNAGLPVKLLEMTQEALDRGLKTIRKTYESQVVRGKLAQEECARRLALLSSTLSYEDLRDADLVVEAVFEEMQVKRQVFETLDKTMKPGAILASNTSTLDLDQIAAFTARPQDVVGMHFFSPAHVMKLLEVVRGKHTSHEVLATVMALARKIRKTAVVAGVCDGFIGNRMIEQYARQAGFLLDEGCLPQQVDRAIEAFGFAMGPFRMNDLAGNDISWAIRKRRAIERPDLRYSGTADRLCELGRFGQKTGAGWYDYPGGQREAVASSVVDEMIASHRQSLGITPRTISDEEIVQRLVYALINEGAHLLEEGIAQRASDIDVVYLTGYGFPMRRGGPMHYADRVGLSRIVDAMAQFARNPLDDARFWQPAPLLSRLAAAGRTFN